ncbi:MAG: hypothetical protein JSS95_06090 [Acidobacteria bacterium]|nr:hypothetical protein [Acidobacteriota bacterium]
MLLAAGVSSIFIAGCGSGVLGTAADSLEMQGSVQGGLQPVSGAAIRFFAASTKGSNTSATQMSTAKISTSVSGAFSLPSNFKCINGSDQIYVVATGGNPGGGSNSSLALMSDIGTCSKLTSKTRIYINEVTTIASVYALAQFMNPNTFDVASSSGDAATVAAAYSAAGTLANLTTGDANSSSPVYKKLNSLADSLATCVNSATNSKACSAFFAAATTTGSSAPANTIAAILNIALHPTNNVDAIYNLASVLPFQPTLSASPVDWTLFGATAGAIIATVDPVVSWSTPAAVVYGTQLSAAQLNATASVPGTFTYTPAVGTVLSAGLNTLTVNFTPSDTSRYNSKSASATLVVNKATPAVNWTPSSISAGTALSSAQLNATASTVGSFAYTPSAGTVLSAGTTNLSAVFTPKDSGNYTNASKSVSVKVGQGQQQTPTITWHTPAPISYGTALSTAQLNAVASVPGTFSYSPALGAVPTAGNDTLSVTFTPTDTTTYSTATATVTLVVNKGSSAITWATPAPIVYGTALSASQLNASASIPGTFTYSPAAGAIPAAGTDTLSVTFTPNDTATYSTSIATVSLQVNKATPVISWATPAAIAYGTALSSTQLNATAPIAGSFTYTPAAGTTLSAGNQTLSVTFAPSDTSNYINATQSVTLKVNGGASQVTWATPNAITYGTALSSTQLNATASIPGAFSYSPASGTVLDAGTRALSVTFTPNDSSYATQTSTVNLIVNKATPVITWANPASIAYGTTLSTTQLNATSSVPGNFAYTPAAGSTPATGTSTLSALFTPTDSANYNSTTKTVSLTVGNGSASISWPNPAAITYGTALSATQLNASASVPGSFTYSPAIGTVLTAGTQTLSATFTPTDTANYSTQTVSDSLVVNKATPVVTWATPSAIANGTALSSTQLNATASVPGSFVYSPAGGTVLPAGTSTLNATFTPTDTTNYATRTATVSLVVSGSSGTTTPTVNWSNPVAITYGTALSSTQLNATASVPGAFSYSPAAGTVLAAGTRTLSVTFTPTDTTYSPITASVTVVVNKANPTITWATPAAISYGTALSSSQLNATASVPGTLTYSPALGTVLGTGTTTLSVSFNPTDASYATATATVALVVNKLVPTVTWATPAAIASGTALSATQLNATASVPGSFVYSPALGTILSGGTNTLNVTFTPTDTAHYSTATASVSLSVTGGSSSSVTNIAIGTTVVQTGMKRLGMNISGQSYYDSGQMLRNLVFRNPGFEGELWQTILKCAAVTATSCTDTNTWAQWPANFVQGASYEFIYGGASGQTGTVTSSTAATSSQGVTINFAQGSKTPKVGDFVVVKMSVPGNPQAGWWSSVSGGATLSPEYSDLSPNTVGKQALRVTAAGSGQSADISSYFDSYAGRSFIQLNGNYKVAFRAKGAGGSNQLSVTFQRLTSSSSGVFLSQTVSLGSSWQDYSYTVSANETGNAIGTVKLAFDVAGANVLLDDVSITPVAVSSGNLSPFRDEVVNTLKDLHPGVLRYWDSETSGSTIDNLIAPAFARQRAGFSMQTNVAEDVTLGLHEFLQLCQTVGAEPYFDMPAGMSPTEAKNLVEYLGGDSSTPYGAKRAALGQAAPWTSVFPVIHLELGNEQWNSAVFHGEAIDDPVAYGQRAAAVYAGAKASSGYNASSFNLVLGSWAGVPWWTQQEAANSANFDSVSVAPYIFDSLNDTSSNEAIFGPMLAQPEMIDSVSTGYMYQQAQAAKAAGTKLVIYEVNLGAQTGTADQATVNAVMGSVAGGLAVAEHMLLMARDLGITTQNLFALPGYNNMFTNTASGGSESVPLFGSVIDMGGQTNLRRPNFLAEQLANTAIMPTILATTLSGANPTWNQALSSNDSIQLNGAHEIQTFAFTDGGNNRSVIMFNLSRTTARPVTFSGANIPTGTVNVGQLTSANLTDNNETSGNVKITNSTLSNFQPSTSYSLPPFSMTVFTWQQ